MKNIKKLEMQKVYFKECLDIVDDITRVDCEEMKSRFTVNKPYVIIDINYITTKKADPVAVKCYLITNDYGVGEWVYDCFFYTKEEWRNKQLGIILE